MRVTGGRAVGGAVGLIVVLLACTCGVARASGPTGSVRRSMAAAEVVKLLAAGRSFRATHLRILGDLDLSGVPLVKGSFRCPSCTFERSIIAPDTEFGDVVDLAKSIIRGSIDMQGAVFDRSAVFTGAVVTGQAGFDTAIFAPTASFDNMSFGGTASFTEARFQGDATFNGTDFGGPALFTGAAFLGDALFDGLATRGQTSAASARCAQKVAGAFGDKAEFGGAAFHGRADFGGRCFARVADFSGITVTRPANFNTAQFVGTATFEGASFGDDASFTLATFSQDASFDSVSVGHNLTFDATDFGPELDLDGAAISGTLSLDTAFLPTALDIENANMGGIVLNPGDVSAVITTCGLLPCTQITILQKIEQTARAAGDTVTANDARYDWLALAGQARLNGMRQKPVQWIWTWFQDRLCYRWVAGYLVRPLSPALVFIALLVLGFACRIGRLPQPAKPAENPPEPSASATPAPEAEPDVVAHMVETVPSEGTDEGADHKRGPRRRDSSHWIRAFLDVGAVAFSPRPPPELKDATSNPVGATIAYAAIRWIEFAGFKVLTVLIITCIANYNETLHQFIESIIR